MSEASSRAEPIAILGVGCRFPGGADDPEAFWRLLAEGRDVVGPVPRERWDLGSLYHPDYRAPGRIHQRHGGFVQGIEDFDAAFFGISPKEAVRVDPQHRLLLEAAHQALENAGIGPWSLSGSRTGVFVGISTRDYAELQTTATERDHIGPHTNQGVAGSIAANRLSFTWNLLGPSMAIDTACSSVLYALHTAVAFLRAGDCDLALVGGANALLRPEPTIGFSKGSFLSARGRCQAFSRHADGFVRAEGAGMLVLKPLSNALADGDRVLAVIRHTEVNEDGHTSGMALPSEPAQMALLRDAYGRSGLDPHGIGYVEAHGTGTAAGDPIEARAIGEILGRGRPREHRLLMGSVKTNIGHLEAASGVASLVKLTLMLRRRQIPASLHADELNPSIPFGELGLEVVRSHRAWPEWNEHATASTNGFGFGGANAHAILEAAPSRVPPPRASAGELVLATLSGRSPEGLRALAASHVAWAESDDFSLPDVASGTLRHRDHHAYRAAIVARDRAEWTRRLQRLARGEEDPGVIEGHARGEPAPIAFVCSGQGPEHFAMGRHLYATDATFRAAIDEVADAMAPHAPWRLVEEMHRPEAECRYGETEITQPALFAIHVGLARVLADWGIRPDAVVGHSVGEVSSAAIAGVLPLARAAEIVVHRGRVMQGIPSRNTGMLAIGADQAAARRWIARFGGALEVATVNRPDLVVVGGDKTLLGELAGELAAKEVFHRLLKVQFAFHTHHFDPVLAELDEALRGLDGGDGALPLYSTVTGSRVDGTTFTSTYWSRNVRQPVQFVEAVRAMVRDGYRRFVELSPHPVLEPGIEAVLKEQGAQGTVVPALRRETDEVSVVHAALSRLYVAGHPLRARGPSTAVALPYTPWDRRRYWLEHASSAAIRMGTRPHPAVSEHRPSPSDATRHSFRLDFDPRVDAWLRDHVVQGMVVVPGAALLEAAIGAGRSVFGAGVFLEEVSIERALFAPDDDQADPPEVWLEVDGDDGRFRIVSRAAPTEDWVRHASGRLNHRGDPFPPAGPDVDGARSRCAPLAAPDVFYPALAERGLQFGPTFRTLTALAGRASGGSAESLAEVRATEERGRVHPIALDACFQALVGAALAVPGFGPRVYLPVGMRWVRLADGGEGPFVAHAVIHEVDDQWLYGDAWLIDASGRVVASVLGFEGKALSRGSLVQAEQYEVRWLPSERPDQHAGREAWRGMAPFEAVAGAFRAAEARSRRDLEGSAYATFETAMDGFALACIVAALRKLGVDLGVGSTMRLPLPGVSGHERMSARMVRALQERDWITPVAGGWTVVQTPPEADPTALFASLQTSPQRSAELDVVAASGLRLAAVMSGEMSVADALFGDEGKALARLYASGFQFERGSGILAEALRAAVAAAPADRELRVLEIGAGTGGLTSHLLPVLPEDRTRYVYTDVSMAFAQGARERFAAFPFVELAELDIERDPAEQGFGEGTFDVLVASDVLHATADLRASLRRAAGLLAPGGLLLLLELTDPTLYIDVMFGLTDGWWAFRDTDLRPTHAGLSADRWADLLGEAGFDAVEVGRFSPDQTTRQTVFAARRRPVHVPANDAAEGSVLVLGGPGRFADAVLREAETLGVAARRIEPGELEPELIRGASVDAVLVLAGDADPGDLEAVHARIVEPLRRAAVTLAGLALQPPPRLVAVTRGAVVAVASDRGVDVAQGAAQGLGRVVANELSQVPVRLVDLSAEPDAAEIRGLLREAVAASPERDVALRGASRLVARLDRAPTTPPPTPAKPESGYRLQLGNRVGIDGLALAACDRAEPGPGQVEVDVRAAGLNFNDVMRAMGLLPRVMAGDRYGLEAAGVVTRVGAGVTHVQPGDEVVAVGKGSFSAYLVTHGSLVARKPARLSFAEAATLPVAMGTAWWCLEVLGNLRDGERVLVHAASGGVGHAAVQIARRRGCEIHATAGRGWKREYLRTKLGIEHVYDSRSLDFAAQVMAATGGRGVDVALNSLAGRAIPRTLDCLGWFGRFLEIGITDIHDNARIGLAAFRRNLTYAAVELEDLLRERPEEFGEKVLRPMMAAVERGELDALPVRAFPMQQASEMFQVMARSSHLGKLVAVRDPEVRTDVIPAVKPFVARPDGTWLVTGGVRGFGFASARWLVEHGARHLVLIGRSGLPSESMAEVRAWEARGVQVRVSAVDVSDRARLDAELTEVRKTMPPLSGVIHAAMVLDDGPIDRLDRERFQRVMGPKAGGAWNLHLLTERDPLDHFVLLSSVSEVGGNPGQANYNVANALLASLAWQRRCRGLPSLIVNLGAIVDVGFVARNAGVAHSLEAVGLVGNASADLLRLLGQALAEGATQRVLGTVDWGRVSDRFAPVRPLVARLVARRAGGRDGAANLRQDLAAMDAADRPRALVPVLRKLVARVLAAEEDAVGAEVPITDLGLDSLMLNQMGAWLQSELGVNVPMMRLLKGPTVEELAQEVAGRMATTESPAVDRAEPAPAAATTLSTQRSLLADHELLPGSHVMAWGTTLEGALDVDAIAGALSDLWARHPLFASRFVRAGGEVQRTVGEPARLEIADAPDESAVREAVAALVARPFDFAAEPPVRARLYRLGAARSVLVLVCHHVVYDAVTPFRTFTELAALYAARVTGQGSILEPAGPFEALVAFEQERASRDAATLRRYWREQLAGSPMRLPLPPIERRSPADWEMAAAPIAFPDGAPALVASLAREAGCTPFAVLLTAWLLSLRDVLGEDDLVVGTTVSLRERADLEGIFGPAVNFLALRAQLHGVRTFDQGVARVAPVVAGALEHRAWPFESVLADVVPEAERRARTAFGLDANIHLYDVNASAYAGQADAAQRREVRAGELRFSEARLGPLPSPRPYALACGIWHVGDRYRGDLRYNAKAIAPAAAEGIASGFVRWLAGARDVVGVAK